MKGFTSRFLIRAAMPLFMLALLLASAPLIPPAAVDTAVSTVSAGSSPGAVAVNQATDKIYVANQGSGTVTVIDGVYNDDAHTSTVSVGSSPDAIAVNPVTDMIYIANSSSDNVTVIDGVSNAVYATVNVGLDSYAIAINPVTDKIYVVGYYDANNIVTVIDGASNTVTATVTLPLSVNFTALLSRFTRICRSRSESPARAWERRCECRT